MFYRDWEITAEVRESVSLSPIRPAATAPSGLRHASADYFPHGSMHAGLKWPSGPKRDDPWKHCRRLAAQQIGKALFPQNSDQKPLAGAVGSECVKSAGSGTPGSLPSGIQRRRAAFGLRIASSRKISSATATTPATLVESRSCRRYNVCFSNTLLRVACPMNPGDQREPAIRRTRARQPHQ